MCWLGCSSPEIHTYRAAAVMVKAMHIQPMRACSQSQGSAQFLGSSLSCQLVWVKGGLTEVSSPRLKVLVPLQN